MKDFYNGPFLGDLLYLGSPKNMERATTAILGKWPNAKLEEDWDEIHEYRLAVGEIAGVTIGDFCRFAAEDGFLSVCFGFQMATMMPETQAATLEFLKSVNAS